MKVTFSNTISPGSSFKGRLFSNGRLFEDVGCPLARAQNFDAFRQELRESNGTFAAVVQNGDELWAAVDRLRSMPLFYGRRDGALHVSDDAYWVRGQVGGEGPSAIEAGELWYMLYVLGPNTLSSSVKQLRPGEALRAVRSSDGVRVQTQPYYCYLQQEARSGGQPELTALLDRTLVGVFERLMQTTAGRQIVVPLSGGLDSRLVTCMLKRLGARNVLTFSYGQPENPEAVVSRHVARKLGYEWTFVSYRDWQWDEEDCRRHRRSFWRQSANLCGLPPILEDWYAVWKMKEQGLLEDGAVFCPGHTAGFTSGSAAYAELERLSGRQQLVDAILRRHSPRLHWQRPAIDVLEGMRSHVREAISCMERNGDGAEEEGLVRSCDLYDCWNWSERQCKRIINMVRTYEYWGYDWRVPLWDSQLMDFWRQMPSELRRNKTLYRNYLSQESERLLFGLYDESDARLSARPGGSRASRWMRRAVGRTSPGRYFLSDKRLERVLAGSCARYLRRVGRRALSAEPVTAPWLLMDSSGIGEIWSADETVADRRSIADCRFSIAD